MDCTSRGFSDICWRRDCMPGVLMRPGPDPVIGPIPAPAPVPEVLEPPLFQGFGNGCLFSEPCCGLVPSKKIDNIVIYKFELRCSGTASDSKCNSA